MHASVARRTLGSLIPPKIATPSSVSGGSSASLAPLVEFYSKLPKGPAPTFAHRGPRAWFFDTKNASGVPLLVTIGAMFGLGYVLDYNMHLKHHKNHAH